MGRGDLMVKTRDAVRILENEIKKDPELQKLYEEEQINVEVALAIREMRKRRGLTQEQLAKKIGTTQSVISRLEDADYEGHSMSMLQRIATALHYQISFHWEDLDEDKTPRSAA